jgi:hypothetical protein
VTVISFRAYPIGVHETVSDDALRNLAGQTFVFRDGDREIAASVISAVVREGWIVVTSDVADDAFTAQMAEEFMIGPLTVRVLPDMPDLHWRLPIPAKPDWATVTGSIGPARLKQTLTDGLRPDAAERWWDDRCADASGEHLLGPAYQWVSP